MSDHIPSAEEVITDTGVFNVTERTISHPDDLTIDTTNFEVISFGPEKPTGTPTVDPVRTSPMDAAAEVARGLIVTHMPDTVARLRKSRLISPKTGKRLIAQAQAKQRAYDRRVAEASTVVAQASVGQTVPTWGTADQIDDVDAPGSRQLTVEDFFCTLDFVPLPRNIRFEIYESQMFEENHITGSILSRLAAMVTKRGWDYARTNPQLATDGDDDDSADPEYEALQQWFDNCNTVSDFREIIENLAACFAAVSNAWLEVIRETLGDPTAVPAGLEPAIPSTMRVLRGHRGYVQWLMGQFRWFNVYMPNVEDREAGAELWAEYWEARGVDVEDEDFFNSPWARTLSSEMPKGVWNPFLTDMMHIRDLSMSSKYYGFPKDYRLGKLDALLQWSIDYNISLQRNNRIPPFCIVFHGKLTTDVRAEVKNYFSSLKGPENWGNVPIFEAASGGGPQSGPTKAAVEIIKIAEADQDGIFLNLWERVIKDCAMHYGFPLDLLTTENSNRATVEMAEQMFNENVVNRLHQIFEERFKKLVKYDLGIEGRTLQFNDLDTDDYMAKATEAKIWHDIGALNPDEIRKKYLQMGPRPGGDQYFGVMANPEDEAAEMLNVAKAREVFRDPIKLKAALDAADQATGQQSGAENGTDGGPGGTGQEASPVSVGGKIAQSAIDDFKVLVDAVMREVVAQLTA